VPQAFLPEAQVVYEHPVGVFGNSIHVFNK
jgi:putative transposon-encoded protein